MLISLLLIVPTIYLSGMVFAIESMPVAAQVVSNIVPAKWFISASRKIMVEGVGIGYVAEVIMQQISKITMPTTPGTKLTSERCCGLYSILEFTRILNC